MKCTWLSQLFAAFSASIVSEIMYTEKHCMHFGMCEHKSLAHMMCFIINCHHEFHIVKSELTFSVTLIVSDVRKSSVKEGSFFHQHILL